MVHRDGCIAQPTFEFLNGGGAGQGQGTTVSDGELYSRRAMAPRDADRGLRFVVVGHDDQAFAIR